MQHVWLGVVYMRQLIVMILGAGRRRFVTLLQVYLPMFKPVAKGRPTVVLFKSFTFLQHVCNISQTIDNNLATMFRFIPSNNLYKSQKLTAI
jgi:hypothetical protein